MVAASMNGVARETGDLQVAYQIERRQISTTVLTRDEQRGRALVAIRVAHFVGLTGAMVPLANHCGRDW